MVFECGTVPGRCGQNCGHAVAAGACVMIEKTGAHLIPPKGQALRCDSSRQVLLVLVVVYIVVAIHQPAPAPVKNDHRSRLPLTLDTYKMRSSASEAGARR